MKMPKILVTGGSGFIGTGLVAKLKEKYIVTNYDIVNGDDILDPKFEAVVNMHNVVIHLAAETSVEDSHKQRAEFYYTNVLGTARVVEACMKYGKKLIYPSTAAVYNRSSSPYAQTKGLAEDIVKGAMNSNPVTILRLFNIYSELEQKPGSAFTNYLNGDEIKVYGDGDQTRDYINLKDVIGTFEAALGSEWDGEIVDVGSGISSTSNYIAGLFAFYRKKEVVYGPPRREIRNSVADTSAFKRLYGSLQTDVAEDIKRMCERYE